MLLAIHHDSLFENLQIQSDMNWRTQMKKVLSLLLVFTLCFYASTITIFANNQNHTIDTDLFEETVLIGSQSYCYRHFTNDDGYGAQIINCSTGATDILYVDNTNRIYLNDECIGNFNKKGLVTASGQTRVDGWNLLSYEVNDITWQVGVGVAVLYGIFAAVIGPMMQVGGVVAAISYTTMATIAASSIGGQIYSYCYQAIAAPLNIWYHWAFTPPGSSPFYGWYNTYIYLGTV